MKTLIILAILPAIIILDYINRKDSLREPDTLLRKCLKFGALATIPVVALELLLSKFYFDDFSLFNNEADIFISMFFSVALIEEFFKWLVVRYFFYNNEYFDESFDPIVYSVHSAVGFATVENFLYIICSGSFWFFTGLVRLFTAVPGHAIDGVFMGYFFSKAKKAQVENDTFKEKRYLLLSLLVPIIAHTIYDFWIEAFGLNLIWFLFLFALYFIGIKIVNKASEENVIFETNARPSVETYTNNNINLNKNENIDYNNDSW